MNKLFVRSKRLLVLASTIALIVVTTILFYFDSNMNFLQSQQHFRNENNVVHVYNAKSEFQAMVKIVKKRNDLCSSMLKTSTSSTKKQKKSKECTRACSKLVMDGTLQQQKINLTHHLNMNNFDFFTELLPDFPCFPLTGCRCPAPECILEKRTDAFAENFRRNRKILSENRNEFRLKFHYYENNMTKTRNINAIYDQFATIDEQKFLELNSEKFAAIHDEYLCVQNPFYEQPKTKVSKNNGDDDDDAVDELHCRNPNRENKNGDALPIVEIQKNKINVTNSTKENLELLAMKNVNRFKRLTSWGFSRWYDWKINNENNSQFQFVFPQEQRVDNNNNSNNHSTKTTSRKRKFIWQNNPDLQPEIVTPDGTTIKINERIDNNNNTDDENSRISGGYDDAGVYRLENVCLTPEGKPFGYFGPKEEMEKKFRPFQNSVFGLNAVNPVKPFHGSSEVGRLASKINNVVQDWISHIPPEGTSNNNNQRSPIFDMTNKMPAPINGSVRENKNNSSSGNNRKKYSPLDDGLLSLLNFGQLPFPPPFFVDGKFMLMGVDWKSDNPGHVFYRFLAARNIAKKVWGMSSKNEATEAKNSPTTGDDVEQELAQEYLRTNNTKSKYDNSSYEDFHVIYLLEPKSDVGEKTLAGYKYFYDLLGSSWSTILNRPAENVQKRSQFFSPNFLQKLKFSSQLSSEQKLETFHEEFLEHVDSDDEGGENSNDDSEMQQHEKFLKAFFQSSMVCFKEIVVAHTCGTKSCSLEKQFPSNGYHVPYVQTMSNSQKIFLRYFRLIFIDRCLSKEKIQQDLAGEKNDDNDSYQKSLKTAKTTICKVTLLVRKTSRIDLGLASAIPAISAKLKSLSSSPSSSSLLQLRVVSQQDLTPKQFLKIIHHETDILIGSMGASLSYLWLLKTSDDEDKNLLLLSSPFPSPSSSLIVEISGLRSCAFVPYDKKYSASEILLNNNNSNDKTVFFHDPKKAQGWNLHPHCDFGAMAQAVGTQHLAVSLPKFSTKGIWTGKREKNIDLVDAEEKFIFDFGGSRNQNHSWMEKMLEKKKHQKLNNVSSALSTMHFVASEILDELNSANNTNAAQTQYDNLFTEEMSVLYKFNQSVLTSSIMISSSSSTRGPGADDRDEKPVTSPTQTNFANHKVQLWFDNKPRRRRVSTRKPFLDHSHDKVKSSTYPLGVKTPVTYVGTDLYLRILESCLCRHFEIKMMMMNSSTTTGSEMENILDEKCPWKPKDVKYAKLKWGVDS